MGYIRSFYLGIFFLYLLGSHAFSAQVNSATDTILLKKKIEELFRKDSILQINTIINKNTSLNPDYVFKIINRNLKSAIHAKNPYAIAETYNAMGNFWARKGNLLKAYDNFLECELISKKNGFRKTQARSILNQGNVLQDENRKIRKYKEAIQLFQGTTDYTNTSRAHLNLGYVYLQKSADTGLSKDSADYYNQEAYKEYLQYEKSYRQKPNKEILALFQYRMAEWHMYQDQNQIALEKFKESEKNFEEIGKMEWVVNCLLSQAFIEEDLRHYTNQFNLLKKAEKISSELDFNKLLADTFYQYYVYYSNIGDLKNALKYQELFYEKREELSRNKSKDNMKLVEMESQMKEKQMEIDQTLKEKKLFKILSILGIFSFIATIIISYLIIQNKKRKISSIEKDQIIANKVFENQQLQKELLDQKAKMSQHHLNKFINLHSKIDRFLEKLREQVKSGQLLSQEEINDIKINFSTIINSQTELDQIKTISAEKNLDFFTIVKHKFPLITESDSEFLSLILDGISSKEIAHILNISPDSVNKKRYRLRKKLNLENHETFQDFYEQTKAESNLS